MEPADFLTDAKTRPEGGAIVWATATDGVRLRVGLWPRDGAKGTVLIFQGRAEYVEKSGPLAKDLAERGYASATIDWRGQGYSQRLAGHSLLGHVDDALDYQHDVATLKAEAEKAGLPRPWFILAHSTGGMIALRSLIDGFEARAVAFSAPLWSISLSPLERVFATIVPPLCGVLGLSKKKAPLTSHDNYVLTEHFDKNVLTSDRDKWDFMYDTLKAHPQLSLGAPTCGWVTQVLKECRAFRTARPPDAPCYIAVGTQEEIVDPRAIHQVANRWPGATVELLDGARHEIIIERPELRNRFIDACVRHFDAQIVPDQIQRQDR